MFEDQHCNALLDPPIEFRPEVRWWLAEGLHTDRTLRHEIDSAYKLGFGGMEFLAMDEGNIDHSRYGWGAEEWVHDSQIVVEETTKHNMSFSFTSGTNWSNANLPTIDPDDPAAAQELDYCTAECTAKEGFVGKIPQIDLEDVKDLGPIPLGRVAPKQQHLVAVVAAPMAESDDSDEAEILDIHAATDLTDCVHDEQLSWKPSETDDRTWKIFFFWSHGTGQTASPSASVNYTVNYLDKEGVDAVIDYWEHVVLTPELRKQIQQNPRAQMYMDSLELNTWGRGGMFWGRCVAEEFEKRRGYQITTWLPFLVRTTGLMAADTTYHYEALGAEEQQQVEKVRFDYVRTLTDLYIDHMLRPFAAFLHENGIQLRSEISYGLPFELTCPGPEVDGIETESLEFGSQIDAYRLLAGPAHLFGKQYSSETGATTRNHMLEHRFYDQIIATQLAAGITKTVLHGWSSMAGAPGATSWPGHEGMWPMFSERFDLRQPASEFYPLWNKAIGRKQYILRQGKPRIDVGILRTDHFTDNLSGTTFLDPSGKRIPDEYAYGHMWMRNRDNHWWQDLGMQDAGWTYEFFDPTLLLRDDVSCDGNTVQEDGPGYQALIVYQEALDLDVAELLYRWARQGLPILVVNGARELKLLAKQQYVVHHHAASRTPGLDGKDDELREAIMKLAQLSNVAVIDDPAQTINALRALGVQGRAEFAEPNRQLLTHMRQEGRYRYLYVYNFLYENNDRAQTDIVIPARATVKDIDCWTGKLHEHHGVQYRDSSTLIHVDLGPGETAIMVIDEEAADSLMETSPSSVSELAQLNQWEIEVESWDAGEDEEVTEDRGLGYVTTEVRPTTDISTIKVSDSELKPWCELEEVGPEVSGVGEYRAVFTMPEECNLNELGRLILDLGNTSGGLGSVQVNGSDPVGFDTSSPTIDISGMVHSGKNEIVVRVSSSLNNRLIARGYYDDIFDVITLQVTGKQQLHQTTVKAYGLQGPVRLLSVK